MRNRTNIVPREWIILRIFFLMVAILLARLCYIQLLKNMDYSQKAVAQRVVKIPVKLNRGEILDRNGMSFTNRDKETKIIVYTNLVKDFSLVTSALCRATGLSEDEVKHRMEQDNVVEFDTAKESFALDQIKNNKFYGVTALESYRRYAQNGLLRHVIGKLDEHDTPESGLEKKFNQYLQGSGNSDTENVVSMIDSSKNMIQGFGTKTIETKNNSIVTTIDYQIQAIVEQVMDQMLLDGAVVMEDVRTGEIVAMASRPNFRQDVEQTMVGDAPNFINKAVQGYNIGSIFKIVTLAAALEENKVDFSKTYLCNHSFTIGDTTVRCSGSKKHFGQPITPAQAFAYSCNTVFIQLAQDTGGNAIIDMAKRFGIGKTQLTIREEHSSINPVNESAGKLPQKSDGISNIAIGQGSTLVTPVQAVNIAAIIANDGVEKKPSIIKKIIDESGDTLQTAVSEPEKRIISEGNAKLIQEMMHLVTVDGSGKAANLDEFGGAAGKTGTAEAGPYTHGWFAGYFPYNEPQYAVCVFAFDGKSGGGKAAPIFREIFSRMIKMGLIDFTKTK